MWLDMGMTDISNALLTMHNTAAPAEDRAAAAKMFTDHLDRGGFIPAGIHSALQLQAAIALATELQQ